MAEKDDFDVSILAKPTACRALIVLREAELAGKLYLNAGELETAIPVSTNHAIIARNYLLHWKLITEETGVESRRIFARIRLTEKGRDDADDLIRIQKRTHGNAKVRPSARERA